MVCSFPNGRACASAGPSHSLPPPTSLYGSICSTNPPPMPPPPGPTMPPPGPTDQCRQSYCTESVLEAVRPLLEDRLTQTERTYIDGTDARTEWVFVWYSEPTDRMDIQGCRTRGQPPPSPPPPPPQKKIKY